MFLHNDQQRGGNEPVNHEFDMDTIATQMGLGVVIHIESMISGVEVDRPEAAPHRPQFSRQPFDIALAVDDVPPFFDGFIIRDAVELGGVNSNAARLEQAHGVFDELRTTIERPKMLHGATAPEKIKAAVKGSDVRHVRRTETDETPKFRMADVLLAKQRIETRGMLAAGRPLRVGVLNGKVRSKNLYAAAGQNGGQRFGSDCEAQPTPALPQHISAMQNLKDRTPLPYLAVAGGHLLFNDRIEAQDAAPIRVPFGQKVFVATDNRVEHDISPAWWCISERNAAGNRLIQSYAVVQA